MHEIVRRLEQLRREYHLNSLSIGQSEEASIHFEAIAKKLRDRQEQIEAAAHTLVMSVIAGIN